MCNIKYMYFNMTIATSLYFFPSINFKKILILSSAIKTRTGQNTPGVWHMFPALMEFRNLKHKKISNNVRQFEVCQLIANNKWDSILYLFTLLYRFTYTGCWISICWMNEVKWNGGHFAVIFQLFFLSCVH